MHGRDSDDEAYWLARALRDAKLNSLQERVLGEILVNNLGALLARSLPAGSIWIGPFGTVATREELEELLLAGLASGEPRSVTDDDWERLYERALAGMELRKSG